jgi:hypothetical protein
MFSIKIDADGFAERLTKAATDAAKKQLKKKIEAGCCEEKTQIQGEIEQLRKNGPGENSSKLKHFLQYCKRIAENPITHSLSADEARNLIDRVNAWPRAHKDDLAEMPSEQAQAQLRVLSVNVVTLLELEISQI